MEIKHEDVDSCDQDPYPRTWLIYYSLDHDILDSSKTEGDYSLMLISVFFFFILYFLPDGNKKNKKKSHEYLEATTDVACRDLTLEPWGPHGLGTWKTGGSL